MLYTILKPVVKTALRLYFGRVITSGLEKIDNGKPTIILANHTASFLDAMLLACFVKRRICFFTRGDVFSNRWADKFLRSLSLLPVYRINEGRDKLHLNENSNTEALRILSKGGAVLIFAEGQSDINKVLMPLKKGPFRLAAMAAATLPQPPQMVALGINYSTPVQPFGDVFLNAGLSIPTANFLGDQPDNQAKTATIMMRHMSDSIQPLVWHIRNPVNIPLVEDLFSILKNEQPNYSFLSSQQLLYSINNADSRLLEALRADWEEYHLWQRQHPLNPHTFAAVPSVIDCILFLILLPVAIIGYYCNRIPFYFAEYIVKKKVTSLDFWAPVFIACALVFTFIWYILWFFIWTLNEPVLAVLRVLVVVAICGIVYIKVYRKILARIVGYYQSLMYPRKNPSFPLLSAIYGSLQAFVRKSIQRSLSTD